MTVYEIMKSADELIRYSVRFLDCSIWFYPDFEYCYLGECNYLIRHKESGVMMFVKAQMPKEAIETMIDNMRKGGLYVD